MSFHNNPKSQQQPDGFKIRVYSKAELAALYFPDKTKNNAAKAFKRFLSEHQALYTQLVEVGYNRVRLLTPKMVQNIVENLGAQ